MFCIRNVLSLASGVHANVVFLVSSKSLGYIQRPELTVGVSSVTFRLRPPSSKHHLHYKYSVSKNVLNSYLREN